MDATELCIAYWEVAAGISECGDHIRSEECSCPEESSSSEDHPLSCLRYYYEATWGIWDRDLHKDRDEWKAVEECPQCLACHGWVEKRRALKKQRGILRRQITKLGKRLKANQCTPAGTDAEPATAITETT